MPVFVEVTPDPFATSFRSNAVGDSNEDGSRPGSARASRFGGFDHVRRPVRGIQVKEDTYATIQVRTADGRNIPLVDAGGSITDDDNPDISYTEHYSNFLLQNMQEQRAEKMQVVQTFGEPFVFFFGEQPRVISASGVLINTEDFNWRAEFWENYNLYLRGTKCVQSRSRVTLSWDDIVVEGYFIKANAQESQNNKNIVNLSFQMFLTNYQNVSRIGFSQFPKGAEEVNLDPLSLDTTGEGIGNLQSVTQKVRSLNSSSFGVKNSLFESLRDQAVGQAKEYIELDGRLASLVELGADLISNNKVRAPVGFAGGTQFDQETQIALASVDANSRLVLLHSQLGGQNYTISGHLGRKTSPTTFGRFQDNVDEYIAKVVKPTGNPINPPDLFSGQKADDRTAEAEAKAIFEAFGVQVDPPKDVTADIFGAKFSLRSVVKDSGSAETIRGSLRRFGDIEV